MMTKIENRSFQRNVVSIPSIVIGHENPDESWEERTEIINISTNSAGLTLHRKCEIGHLLFLFAPIPLDMRGDERTEENYTVWGIVQRCTEFNKTEGSENYQIGLALIGEKPPSSYFENPLQYYRITGMEKNGFWKVEETEKKFIPRKYLRFSSRIEVYLAIIDEQSNIAQGEKVWTENISGGGAAVFTNLNLKVGDCVKVIAAEYEFSALAVVRNLHPAPDGMQKVRVGFIAAKFPVEKVKF